MKFPVWSKCVSAQGTVKKRLGSVNVPVTCAGAAVEPGDVVIGDDDGVVIVPRAAGGGVLAAAKASEEKEARSRERYQRGELFLDMNDMRGELERWACVTSTTRNRRAVIIDVHGHYTTAPQSSSDFAAISSPPSMIRRLPRAGPAPISDDEIRESIELNQLRILHERGGDLMLFSPKASGMEHHIRDQPTATAWARASNDLVHRVTRAVPRRLCAGRSAAADAGRRAWSRHRRIAPLCQRTRLRRLQPQPRPGRRLLDDTADDRRVLVSALRGDGGPRGACDAPRVDVVQSELPYPRRSLSQRRYQCLHATRAGGSVRASSRP